jgi:peptide/nickel transport system ATP-binding protein
MGALLSLQNVRAAYRLANGVELHAVDDVSLELREGEVLGVVGESGCGKSTLGTILALNAAPPLYVKSGTLEVQGRSADLTKEQPLPRSERGRLISVLPQSAMNSINPTTRVRDLAFDVLRAHERITRKAAWGRAGARLEQLGLPTRALERYPHELSGGMRQRVITVISTLLDPTILIADEPTSALDVSSQRAVVEMLKDLLARKIISGVLFITHDLPLLHHIADRVAVMYAGKIAEIGPTERVINTPEHPYARALVGSILVPEPHIRAQRVSGIPGSPPDLAALPQGCRFHPRCPLADARSRTEVPPLVQVGTADGHFAACWRTLEAQQPLTEKVIGGA